MPAQPPSPPNPRRIAATVLARIDRDQAFAAPVLDAEIARYPQLSPRDRALATELAYGSLRVRPWLEMRLNALASRGIGKLDPLVRAHLTIAAYQLAFLSRVPAFAAVNECVSAIRSLNGPQVGAFANAVLRKLSRELLAEPANLTDAVSQSVDPWLRDALTRSLGSDGASAFIAASAEVPPVGLRVDSGDREAVAARVRELSPDADVCLGLISPRAVLVRDGGRVADLPGYGVDWSIQEEGSQVVALSLGAKKGEVVLDACAGRGNKSALLIGEVGDGAVDAADLHASKLARLQRELAQIGRAVRSTFAVDWSIGKGELGLYDRVLVDAPCSGIGTIRRRPELALRRTAESIATLSNLQTAILSRTAETVKPGGSLVYAVCSVLREEGEDVVERFLAQSPDFTAAPFDSPVADRLAKGGASFRLLPHQHGTDGYFVASFRRTR